MIITDPNAIEARSMEIIESELPFPIPEENKAVVKRVIHCTADFDYASNLKFSPGAVSSSRTASSTPAAMPGRRRSRMRSIP